MDASFPSAVCLRRLAGPSGSRSGLCFEMEKNGAARVDGRPSLSGGYDCAAAILRILPGSATVSSRRALESNRGLRVKP
ncbi:hypothetical protein MRX96_036115 [Rhipicephalus microplus]